MKGSIYKQNESVIVVFLNTKKLKLRLEKMAKTITDRQKAATKISVDKVDWFEVQMEWLEWLDENIFGNINKNKIK